MEKNSLTNYIGEFFGELKLSVDGNASTKRDLLEQCVLAFLTDETKDTAFDVYKLFFGTYRITMEGEKNPFMDLLDVLSAYEEKAATLIDKQRDHYIHSVNVFILGLSIYAKNSNYRKIFCDVVLDEVKYPENFKTKHEEFFYRWGIASLFHDVGYPVEIIGKQVLNFLKFATNADHDDSKGDIKAHLEFENFRRLNSISEVIPKKKFIDDFYEKNDSSVYIDLLQPIDLLAQKIHMAIGIPIRDIKDKLDNFTADMAKYGFIDHGFYSAIIVLKWYGYLIQITNGNPMRFYNAIVDSAGAILLHNYYRNVIQKQFDNRPLNAHEYPIAYLLMFCDEMQEWNRVGYGSIEKYRTHAASANVQIGENRFDITYLAGKGIFKQDFIDEKVNLFESLLNIKELFIDGLKIDCDTLDEVYIEAREDVGIPRPLLENMEMLGREIHNDYIRIQQKKKAKIHVEEDYDKLKPSVRFSNLRQAMNMDKKLRLLGYAMVPEESEKEALNELPENIIEQYAILEHNDWMAGKIRFGAKYAPIRNDDKNEHPCILPWEELPEEEKGKDRDAARSVIKLSRLANMKVIKI